jgi:outer membrane biosynthesis protein TonB
MGKIIAGVSTVIGLALLGFAAAGSATAIPAPRKPSVHWIEELSKPVTAKVTPIAQPVIATPEPAKPELAPVIPKLEPAKPEPAKPAIAQPAPAKPEPAKPEPAKPAIAQPAPAKPEPAKPEPAKPAVAQPAPARPEPKPLAPAKAEPQPKPVAAAPAPKAEPEGEGIGTLSVTSEPTGAAVFLDGANVGQTPIDIDVPAGNHKIRAVPPGDGAERRQSVIVKSGVTSRIDILF